MSFGLIRVERPETGVHPVRDELSRRGHGAAVDAFDAHGWCDGCGWFAGHCRCHPLDPKTGRYTHQPSLPFVDEFDVARKEVNA